MTVMATPSGSFFLRGVPGSAALLAEWAAACDAVRDHPLWEQQALHHVVLTVDELKQRVVALEARLRKAHVGPGSSTEVAL